SGADGRGADRARIVPPAAAAGARRRRAMSCGLCRGHRGNRQARRQHRLVLGPGVWLHDDGGLSRSRGRAGDLRRQARHCRVGPAEARAVPGGYRLSGTWSFASGSHHASWLGAHVPILAADGTPQQRPDGGPVMRTLLFPKAGARFADIWRVIGLRGTGSDSYTVTDLFVPEEHTVLREAAAKPRQPGLLYAFSSSNLSAS